MVITAQRNEKFFFPHRKTLKLFKENYSPDLLRKISYAGLHATASFGEAVDNLKVLGEFLISESHVKRIATRISKECADLSEKNAKDWKQEPQEKKRPEVAVVSVDGGRAQTREDNGKQGVYGPAWKETKVACLQEMDSKEVQLDPHPMLPKAFLDKKIVRNLAAGLKGEKEKKQLEERKEDQYIEKAHKKSQHIPKILKRFAFATVANADTFGNQVLHKAHQKNFHRAKRKAFVGDGDIKIWTMFTDYFEHEGFIPILDFVHAIEHAFSAASLSTKTESQCWAQYIDFATHIWQGRILTVYRRIDKIIKRLEDSNKKGSKTTQTKIKQLITINLYFKNNYQRTKYPEYRKKGLPVSSCHVESLIKQFNRRVKSTEKFWHESSLKGVLAFKSMLLSDDNSLQQYWTNRYELQQTSKRPYEKAVV